MNSDYAELVKIIANGEMDSLRLRRALLELFSRGVDRFVRDVIQQNDSHRAPTRRIGTAASEGRILDRDTSTDPADQVVQLLRLEANLSSGEAAKLILDRINIDAVGTGLRTPDQRKMGFKQWVDELSRHVSYSEILRIATLIRNERTHSVPPQDWPIRPRSLKR